jgi:pimeloyl-ACP methyl ester carboxylesterase
MTNLPRAALLFLVVLAAACGGTSGPRAGKNDAGACMRLQSERVVRGEVLCEDVWTCFRPPNGLMDRIGLRRLAPCQPTSGPVVLYLPGMHQNAEFIGNDASHDLRLYLAQAGIRTWSLDWRTHAVPPDATPDQLAQAAKWDADTFAADAAWATEFIAGAEQSQGRGPLYVVGFSFGTSIAYALASRGDLPISGLVIIDGAPSDGRTPAGDAAMIDVGSSRLPWAQREALLRTVLLSPNNPSPVPGYRTAGAALGDILFTSQSFGGNGGLTAARDGVSDIHDVALLLTSYDRWWPRATLGGRAPSPRSVPVMAFASGNMGPEWVERVRAGAKAYGGDKASVKEIPLHGHLDLLVGRLAVTEIFEPVRRWISR